MGDLRKQAWRFSSITKYKLKPSFSMITDEKAKDKVWVGDKLPPQSFNNLIKFDPIWSSWIEFNLIYSNLIQFDPIWSSLIQCIPIWSNLIQFDQICAKLNQVEPNANLIKFDPIWSKLFQFDPIWSNFFQFDQVWSNLNQFYIVLTK